LHLVSLLFCSTGAGNRDTNELLDEGLIYGNELILGPLVIKLFQLVNLSLLALVLSRDSALLLILTRGILTIIESCIKWFILT